MKSELDSIDRYSLSDLLRRVFQGSPGLTQADWAAMLGVSGAALSQWVNERTIPSAEHALRLLVLLRSRDLCEAAVLRALEEAFAGAYDSPSTSAGSLTDEVLDGLVAYASELPYPKAKLLKSTLMMLVDTIDSPSQLVRMLVRYIGNSTASKSPYNWHFATVLGCLPVTGAKDFATSLIILIEEARRERRVLGSASGWAWSPVPALSHRMAPDRYSQRAVTVGLLDALSGSVESFTSYASGRMSLDRIDSVLVALSLLAVEVGPELSRDTSIRAIAGLARGAGPGCEIAFAGEFLRRGRGRWLPESRFRAALSRLVDNARGSDTEIDSVDSLVGYTGPALFSEAIVSEHAPEVASLATVEEVWRFVRSAPVGGIYQDEDESPSQTRQRLADQLLDSIRHTPDAYDQYVYAAAIYDLFVADSADDAPGDSCPKTDAVAYDFGRRLQARVVDDVINGTVCRLAGCLLLDLGCRLATEEAVSDVIDAVRTAPQELACSLLAIPSLWTDEVYRRRLRDAVSGGDKARDPAILWFVDALTDLFGGSEAA